MPAFGKYYEVHSLVDALYDTYEVLESGHATWQKAMEPLDVIARDRQRRPEQHPYILRERYQKAASQVWDRFGIDIPWESIEDEDDYPYYPEDAGYDIPVEWTIFSEDTWILYDLASEDEVQAGDPMDLCLRAPPNVKTIIVWITGLNVLYVLRSKETTRGTWLEHDDLCQGVVLADGEGPTECYAIPQDVLKYAQEMESR